MYYAVPINLAFTISTQQIIHWLQSLKISEKLLIMEKLATWWCISILWIWCMQKVIYGSLIMKFSSHLKLEHDIVIRYHSNGLKLFSLNYTNMFPSKVPYQKLSLLLFLNTVKWGYIEQSYFFHGNSQISFYNKISGPCSRNFLNVPTFDLFLPKRQFSNEKIWLVDVVLRRSFDRKLICPILICSGMCRNHCLIYAYHSLLLFWQEKFE